MYNIFVKATLNEIESPTIDLGNLALVEAFPYEESYHRRERPSIVVYSPPRIRVKVDGKRIGKSSLPIDLIKRDIATKRATVTFADTFQKHISYDIDKPLIQPDVRILKSINELSLLRTDYTCLSQIKLKHKSESAEHLLERALKDKRDIVFTERDTKSRARSYVKLVADYCLGSKELGTKALVIFPSNALYQEQLSEIVDYLWKVDRHHGITLGIMPSPTPYAEPYLNLEKANRVEREAKISPNVALSCPSCGKLGKYVVIRLQDLNVEGCVECGFSPSVTKTLANKLKVEKTDIKHLDLDEERSEAYIKTAEERHGPFPCYTPVLLNAVLHCPKCDWTLIPAHRINPDTEEEEQVFACPKCGVFIDFISFTLMKLRCFPPDIVLMSAPVCRWLFQTTRGSLFNNFYGKVRLCNKCGRVHAISKPIGRVNENLVKDVLCYIRDNFPSALREAHEQYLKFRHEKRRRGTIRESFVELVQTEEHLDKLRTKILSFGGTIDTDVKNWIKKRLENLQSKLKLLRLEGKTSRGSEVLKEHARVKKEIAELRQELNEKEVLITKLETQIKQIRGKAEWQAKCIPLIKMINVIFVSLGLKWTCAYLQHQELTDSFSEAKRQIEQIKETLKELSQRDEAIERLSKEKDVADVELSFIEEEINALNALKEDYEKVVEVILELRDKLSLDTGDLFTIFSLDDAVSVIREKLSSINFSLYKIVLEYEKAKEGYDEMKKEWKNRIEKWIFERLYEKEMSVIEIENTIDDAIACLKGCGFIDHLYSVTSRGQRFLKGDKTQINSCKCGGSYQQVMIKPRYVVFDDFHRLWFNRFDTMREEPALRLLKKIKKETNARLIVSLRNPQMK
jgi:Zn ribbon nucleic-acid-binding protein